MVVVSWVTFESEPPVGPPVVSANGSEAHGITHIHRTCAQGTESYPGAPAVERCNGGHPVPNARVYYMHFVRLSDLRPRARYEYKVRSGAGARDAESTQVVRRLWDRWLEQLPEAARTPQQQAEGEFRWMIEELRVSLFAQPLGTAVKVSPPRCEKLIH